MPKILELNNFENVKGNPCFIVVLPNPLRKEDFINSEEDLEKALGQMLRGFPKGEYGFVILNLSPSAYGVVKKAR
jgi:hypothetical protein